MSNAARTPAQRKLPPESRSVSNCPRPETEALEALAPGGRPWASTAPDASAHSVNATTGMNSTTGVNLTTRWQRVMNGDHPGELAASSHGEANAVACLCHSFATYCDFISPRHLRHHRRPSRLSPRCMPAASSCPMPSPRAEVGKKAVFLSRPRLSPTIDRTNVRRWEKYVNQVSKLLAKTSLSIYLF